ncbi:MAG: hypothetical protein EOM55_05030, partial [Clostridia bacterium]|nr:hypothetical protein [Clostridia bacterium]
SEDILIKDISTGAQNDIERATKIARKMVTEWGMSSRLGPLNFATTSEVFIGRDYQTQVQYSEKTAAEIDNEVKAIIDDCYKNAKEIIKKHVKQIDTMIEVLLEKETIYYNEVELIMKGKTARQVLLQMEKEETRNKTKIELERAEAELEKVKKEQNIRIKTAEALKNGGVLSQEEMEKVKEDSSKIIIQAEEKVEEIKKKNSGEKDKDKVSKKTQKDDTLISPTKDTLKTKSKTIINSKKAEIVDDKKKKDDNKNDE